MAKQHKIDKTEVKTEHIIQPEFINLDPDNYRSEDIVCKIFEKMKHYGIFLIKLLNCHFDLLIVKCL